MLGAGGEMSQTVSVLKTKTTTTHTHTKNPKVFFYDPKMSLKNFKLKKKSLRLESPETCESH